jgi:hypothetical protein
MGSPKNDDISREKTIPLTSLQTHRASAVSRPGPWNKEDNMERTWIQTVTLS